MNEEDIKDDLRTLHKILWNEHREGTYTIQRALEYINQLESDKKNLIEKLEKANKSDTETVRYYEEMYRNTKDIFYKKSYKRTINMANARRETRKNILEILKGVKNE